jgi:hypothetical protein
VQDATEMGVERRVALVEKQLRNLIRGFVVAASLIAVFGSLSLLVWSTKLLRTDSIHVGEGIVITDRDGVAMFEVEGKAGAIWVSGSGSRGGPTLLFTDGQDRPRLGIGLRADGSPEIRVLDPSGSVIWNPIPGSTK